MTRWILAPRPRPGAQVRLFCLSYAGGGASLYRTWADGLTSDVEVAAIELPGRETRLFEQPFTSMRPLVDALVSELGEYPRRPFALFGHSMGALIAFELARSLRRSYGISPEHLFVSGHGAPQRRTKNPVDDRLPTDAFIDALRQLDGSPSEVLENRELMDLLLPGIRADFAVCRTYDYRDERPLDCPITALGGREDPLVGIQDLAAWRTQTTGAFDLRTYAGGHFFVRDARASVLDTVQQSLVDRRVLAAAA